MQFPRLLTGMTAALVATAALTSCTGTHPEKKDAGAGGSHSGQVVVPGRPGEPARTMPADQIPTRSGTQRPNKADIRFVRMMIPHHYQALKMTELVPERVSGEQVRGLAKRITAAQKVEIDAMRGWQERRGLEVTDAASGYRKQLSDVEHLRMMGMATPAEMDKLKAAEGRTFDRLFLRLMKTHHQGAVTMAETVLGEGRDLGVKQLAKDILVTQKDEIARMRKLLND